MELTVKQGKIANRIPMGDKHDLSIEWFITHTPAPFYIIETIGDLFKISVAEKVEKQDGDAKKETGPTSPPVDEEKPVTGSGTSKFTGGYRGKRGKNRE